VAVAVAPPHRLVVLLGAHDDALAVVEGDDEVAAEVVLAVAELLDALGVQADQELARHGVERGDVHPVDAAHDGLALERDRAVAVLVPAAAEQDPARERGAAQQDRDGREPGPVVGYESENEVSEDENGDSRSGSKDHGHGGLHWVRGLGRFTAPRPP
jgi:hypothetical protein